ncbi:hypothetical protein EHYA_03849 [Embleya hyalina]|uniref:Uncharacterized protein n=1 Tax=Embleya hyalina TaxID=516124 RepID=A0A401YNJ3_9ACTN|nr:hypothetical protein EHYA_03849 [Embleya hyalina]
MNSSSISGDRSAPRPRLSDAVRTSRPCVRARLRPAVFIGLARGRGRRRWRDVTAARTIRSRATADDPDDRSRPTRTRPTRTRPPCPSNEHTPGVDTPDIAATTTTATASHGRARRRPARPGPGRRLGPGGPHRVRARPTSGARSRRLPPPGPRRRPHTPAHLRPHRHRPDHPGRGRHPHPSSPCARPAARACPARSPPCSTTSGRARASGSWRSAPGSASPPRCSPRASATTPSPPSKPDPTVAAGARAALHRAGHHPRLPVGDGVLGCAEHAPYDRMLSSACADGSSTPGECSARPHPTGRAHRHRRAARPVDPPSLSPPTTATRCRAHGSIGCAPRPVWRSRRCSYEVTDGHHASDGIGLRVARTGTGRENHRSDPNPPRAKVCSMV